MQQQMKVQHNYVRFILFYFSPYLYGFSPYIAGDLYGWVGFQH